MSGLRKFAHAVAGCCAIWALQLASSCCEEPEVTVYCFDFESAQFDVSDYTGEALAPFTDFVVSIDPELLVMEHSGPDGTRYRLTYEMTYSTPECR